MRPDRTELTEPYGCWLWTGRTNSSGYPARATSKGWEMVHRALWVEAFGDIPDGMELEHACRNPLCVRPSHKYLVTRRENQRLKSWSRRSKIRECPNGHDLRRNGHRTERGGFVCRKCNEGEW